MLSILAEDRGGGTNAISRREDNTYMNTRPLELITHVADTTTETDKLEQSGFTSEEIISLLWLRQWYQNGGSDRMEIVRHLEFVKLLLGSGKIEL